MHAKITNILIVLIILGLEFSCGSSQNEKVKNKNR
jgi:hypothetical protein